MENRCVVWEIERNLGKGWRTAFLPTEIEQSYRWMDEGLQRRHPLLDERVSVDEMANYEPPLVIAPVWVPTTHWTVSKSEATDEQGWQYGTSWNQVGGWKKHPR